MTIIHLFILVCSLYVIQSLLVFESLLVVMSLSACSGRMPLDIYRLTYTDILCTCHLQRPHAIWSSLLHIRQSEH